MATAAPESPAAARNEKPSGSPSRNYVILEVTRFEDDEETYFVKAGMVEARNGNNAVRKAYYTFKGRTVAEDVTYVAVPESQWTLVDLAPEQDTRIKLKITPRD